MSQFIDRREDKAKKSTVNRQRFLKRFKAQIKRAVSDAVNKRGITDIIQEENINIPAKDLVEPRFASGDGGRNEKVLPGNDVFQPGDHVERPKSQQAAGGDGQASNQGEGSDPFVFQLSKEEFLEVFFDDLALPDLVKKELAKMPQWQKARAGVSQSGTPTNINVVKSMRQASARRFALGGPLRKKIKALETELASLHLKPEANQQKIIEISQEIRALKHRLEKIPYLDTMDLRYNHFTKISKPSTQAVMFCIMDVSGSMDEAKKEIAKRFFILLYFF